MPASCSYCNTGEKGRDSCGFKASDRSDFPNVQKSDWLYDFDIAILKKGAVDRQNKNAPIINSYGLPKKSKGFLGRRKHNGMYGE